MLEGIVSFSKIHAEKGKETNGASLVGSNKLYMTAKEQVKLVHDIENLVSKYTTKDEAKEVYTTINAIVRIK